MGQNEALALRETVSAVDNHVCEKTKLTSVIIVDIELGRLQKDTSQLTIKKEKNSDENSALYKEKEKKGSYQDQSYTWTHRMRDRDRLPWVRRIRPRDCVLIEVKSAWVQRKIIKLDMAGSFTPSESCSSRCPWSLWGWSCWFQCSCSRARRCLRGRIGPTRRRGSGLFQARSDFFVSCMFISCYAFPKVT